MVVMTVTATEIPRENEKCQITSVMMMGDKSGAMIVEEAKSKKCQQHFLGVG